MIEQQNFMILDLNDKMKQENIKEVDQQQKNEENKRKIMIESEIKSRSTVGKGSTKKYCDLYQKASELKKYVEEDDIDYEDIIEDDDDNDSFITIDTDDDDSDCTLENSSSSDSGYTEYNDTNNTSYGINPLFADQDLININDGTEACQDFVFFNQNKGRNLQ